MKTESEAVEVVLDLIRHNEGINRFELSQESRLTLVRVGEIVRELEECELIEQVAP